MKHKLLFICSGNYYRSRFAELLFNAVASQSGLDWEADSRGIATQLAHGLGPISRRVLKGLADRGVEVNGRLRYPMQLQEIDLAEANLVIAMKEEEHRPYLEEEFPAWLNKIEYWNVHDIDVAPVDETLLHIEGQVWALVRRLAESPAG